MLNWIIVRIKEPSTWAGLGAAFLAAEYPLAALICGLLAIIVREPGTAPPE